MEHLPVTTDNDLRLANLYEALTSAYDTEDDGRADAIEAQIRELLGVVEEQ